MKKWLEIFSRQSIGAILMLGFALLALLLANSPWRGHYSAIIHYPLAIFNLRMPVYNWINDGLMSLFFLLVSLEIKYEIAIGELNTWRKMRLPLFAAFGGMLVPALIYVAVNWGNPVAVHGWAVPTATDIAFALGVLNLLHRHIPHSLKIFLIALAIFDDLGAIIIIAIFYTTHLVWIHLFLAGGIFIFLLLLNYLRIMVFIVYLLLSILLWIFLLHSGVQPVLAGVLLAYTIPLPLTPHPFTSSSQLQKRLQSCVTWLILPLFGFANAGVTILHVPWQHWFNTITIGIVLGLFFGKQIGILAAVWITEKLRWVHLPETIRYRQLYAVAIICGIGFTMSLFMGNLAFADDWLMSMVRVGVLVGSLLSGVCGFMLLLKTVNSHSSGTSMDGQ